MNTAKRLPEPAARPWVEDASAADTSAGPSRRDEVKRGLLFGLGSGLAAILCCVSPVVFALFGIATAAEAVTLSDTLYYDYGWYFRGAGAILAAIGVVIYLRQKRACSIEGARRYWRLIAALVAAGAAAYVGLFWFTKYLGIWFA